MKRSLTSLYFVVFSLIVTSCAVGTKEQSASLDSTTAPIEETSTVQSEEVVLVAVDSTSINDEDYGDPGMDGLLLSDDELSAEEKQFIALLTVQGLEPMTERETPVIVVTPGPGVYPYFNFPAFNGMLDVTALSSFLKDSTLRHSLPRYRFSPDKCAILDGFPDGIYIGDLNFKDVTLETPDLDQSERIENTLAALAPKYGVEFLVKFTSAEGDQFFLHFLTFRESGKLIMAILDQRDCGA
jgi:hypothetical protein